MLRSFSVPRAAVTALALVLTGPGLAQEDPSVPSTNSAAPPQEQLDRIEAKLDELLRRLAPEAPRETEAESETSTAPSLPVSSPENYLPGAVALVRAAPTEARRLAEVPSDSVGGFVYAGGPIGLADLSDRGVRYAGLAGVEFQGWLRVAGTGRYQLAADLRVGFGKGALTQVPCLFTAWLEDQALDTASQSVSPWDNRQGPATISLVLGAELQPGLYKFRAWIACAAGAVSAIPRVDAELLIKAPGELNLRPVTGEELIHKPG